MIVPYLIVLSCDLPDIFHFINSVVVPYLCSVKVLHIFFDVKGVLLVIVRKQMVLLMLGYIKLIGEEWSYSPKLHNALAAVHDRNLVLTHKLLSGLLVIQSVGLACTPRIRGIVKVNRFFTQNLRHLF